MPHTVSSVGSPRTITTVGTPHKGAALADFLRNHLSSGGFDEVALKALADSLGFLLGLLEGKPTLPEKSLAGLQALPSAGTAAFNARYPQGVPASSCGRGDLAAGGIQYFSWSGTATLTNLFDVTDPSLFISSHFYPEDNDGLVGHRSSHFGKVIRDDYGGWPATRP